MERSELRREPLPEHRPPRCVYFTRHGQTVWNVENKICGASESDLTHLGQEQAGQLGRRIAGEQIPIDEILYSPLRRAADTARRISEETGIPCRPEPRLTEQNFGRYEGTARDGAEFARAKMDFLCRYGNGESMMELCQRIYNLLDELREADDDKVRLLVAHNGISRAVESYFRDMTNEEFAAFGIGNCELRRYEFR